MITLLTNLYDSDNALRQQELNTCLQKNIENLAISQMIVFCDRTTFERLEELSNVKHILWIIGEGRPSYNDFFKAADEYSINSIRVLTNADIYIPISFSHYFKEINSGEVWALSRWEKNKGLHEELWNHRDSQDTWAWTGMIGTFKGADFTLGLPGCDNKMAKIFVDNGYNVLNPSKTVRTIHLHKSNHRTYNKSQTVPPPYHFITPHTLK